MSKISINVATRTVTIDESFVPLVEDLTPIVPTVVTMRQARLALHQSGLLVTITNAIMNGTDDELKIEWEYGTELRRDWVSLMALANSLGMTSAQLDTLFTLADTL